MVSLITQSVSKDSVIMRLACMIKQSYPQMLYDLHTQLTESLA